MKRPRRILAITTVLLLLISAHQGWRFMELRSLESTIVQLREEGFPTRMRDLLPVEVAESENAAHLYEAAVGLFRAGGKDDAAMELAIQAASRPNCVFRDEADQDVMDRFPPIQGLMLLADLLCQRARDAVGIEGEAASSRDLRAVFALGRHVGRDRILIAQLVRIAIDRKALDVTRDLLLKSEDPRRFFARVEPDDPRGAIADAIAGEMVFVQWMLDRGSVREITGAGSPGVLDSLFDAFRRPGDLRSMRQHLLRLKEASLAARLAPEDAIVILRRLEREAQAGGRIERVGAVAFGKTLLEETSYMDRVTLTRVGVGLLAQKVESGVFPQDLAEVPSEDLGDPFTASIAWVEEGGIRVLRSEDGEDRWELTADSEGGSGESGR